MSLENVVLGTQLDGEVETKKFQYMFANIL